MKTKEEILTTHGEAWEYMNTLEVSPLTDALEAMDEYAKEVAMDFAEWNDKISYTEAAGLLELNDFGYEELFKYFINNVYNKK